MWSHLLYKMAIAVFFSLSKKYVSFEIDIATVNITVNAFTLH